MKHTITFCHQSFSRLFLFLLACLMLGSSLNSRAADYYWVNGAGNWSDFAGHWATTSGGNIFHTVIPTLNDDVYFDANSFTAANQVVLIDNTLIYCHDMNWTGATNNPFVNGLGNTLHIYGSLTLIPNMDWSVKRVDFMGTNPGNLLSQAGHSLDTLYFNGVGTFAFTEDLTAKSIIVLDGSLSTGGFDVTTQRFEFGVAGATVSGDLSNSTLNISNEFKAYYGTINLVTTNCDLNFVNAVVSKMYLWASGQAFNNIYCQSNTETIGAFSCQNLTADGSFYINTYWSSISCADASFSGSATLDCNFTANSIAMNTPGSTLKIRTCNLSNSFTANGICGQLIQIQPIDFLGNASLVIPSGVVTVDYCNITGIQASGGATFNATNSIDGGNNTGWNLSSPAPRTLYWVGGTGNWEDDAHWSLLSGGTGGNCVPSLMDDVFFDANSFSQTGETVTINGSGKCKNMDWTGVGFNPTLTGGGLSSVVLYGSMTLSPGIQWTLYYTEFAGSSTGNTIFTAGVQMPGISINGSGSWSLADEIHTGGVSVYQGTFNSANHDIYAGGFSANGNNSSIFVDFGTSTLYLTDNYMAFDSQLTINSANADLVVSAAAYFQSYDAQFDQVTFLAGGYIGKLTCNQFTANASVVLTDLNAGTASFDASFQAYKITADNLIFAAGVHEFLFDSAQVNTSFTLASDCANTLTLNRYTPSAAQAQFNSAVSFSNLDYLVISNVNASGGGSFVANNSWDMGNNTGWTINMAAARDLYWVGGTGTWNDNAHWSLTSGGSGGQCQPAMQDNATFDANSFSAQDTLYMNPTMGVSCNNWTFTGIPSGIIVNSSSSNANINIFGSVTFVPGMTLNSVALNLLSANAGNTITTGNNSWDAVRFSGSGEWSIQSGLNLNHFSAGNGTFHSNGYSITSGDFNLGGSAILDFSTSTLTALGFYSSPTLTILGDSANVIMTNGFLSFEAWGAHFNSVQFVTTANVNSDFSCNLLVANGNFTNINSQITAGTAIFINNVTLGQNFVCDTLILNNPGKLVKISTMTVNDDIVAYGTSGFPIQIEGLNGGGTLQKASGQICLDYVLIKDINATGGAAFFAGANGVDLGGNSGWIFGPCIPLVTDVWPGDANYDLIADNDDVLNIGLAYGYTGPIRVNASLSWMAQPAVDWSAQFANTANLKHADTDGSGLVDMDDTTAVSLNYGLIHTPRLSAPSVSQLPAPVLYVVSNPDTASLSDTVEVDIFLGTSAIPVDSIYGIAFTVNVDTALVNANYLSVDYTGCWMGTNQVDMIGFTKNLMAQGRVDMALVRTDQQNVNGYGFLTRLGIVIVDNVGAKVTMPIVLTDIKAITATEYLLALGVETDSIVIDTAATVGIAESINLDRTIAIFPNPATDQIQIISHNNDITGYQIYNHFGMLVAGIEEKSNRVKINTTELAQGFYILEVQTAKGKVFKKFEVVK